MEISGNLITTPVDIIVQQCNCTTSTTKGLSDVIKKSLGVYIYDQSRQTGTIIVNKTRKDVPGYVANFMAQRGPGKPRGTDSYENRLAWFSLCLDHLRAYLQNHPEMKSVAFPHGIGCGLAGGNWRDYRKYINDFAESVPDIKVYIVSLQ